MQIDTTSPWLGRGASLAPWCSSTGVLTTTGHRTIYSALLSPFVLAAILGAALTPLSSVLAQTTPSVSTSAPARPVPDVIPPPDTTWQPIGPLQISTASWNLVAGQILSLAADPSDLTGNTLYLGTSGGGVWKSTNAAASPATVTFTPLTDTLGVWPAGQLTSLSIGAVSVQPGGTGVILAGTGNPNAGFGSWYGAGLLRSPDNGNTWTLINATVVDSVGLRYNLIGSAVTGFAWSTTTPSLVVAALAEPGNLTTVIGSLSQLNTVGLYYSQDAGVTWSLATIEDGTQVIQGQQYPGRLGNSATAVVWNPVRQRFYAAVRYHGYYESSDGITWTRLANQPGASLTLTMCPTNPGFTGSAACPLFRGALAVQPSTGDLFSLTVDSNNIDQGLWQDSCHFSSGACSSSTVQFATQITDSPLQSPSGSGTLAQADAALWLAAIPSQQDTLLFVGLQDIWRCSLANSCAWRNTTNTQTCAAAQVSPRQHAVESTFASSGLLYFANDAGLWRTSDGVNQQKPVCSPDDATHFQNLNGGLGSLAQVPSLAEDPGNPSTWLAALGPLGSAAPASDPVANPSTPWNQVLDGEGDVVAIDPADSQLWYATSEAGVAINRCTAGTACDTTAFGNIAVGESQVDNDFQPVAAPWLLDPGNTANMILGTCRVWRGPATGVGWSQQNLLSTMLDQVQGSYCDGNAEIRSLAAAPITTGPNAGNGSEQIYAGMAGVLDGGGLVPGHVLTAIVNNASSSANTTWLDRYNSPLTNAGAGNVFNPAGYPISGLYADPHDSTGQTVYVTVQGVSGTSNYDPVVYRSTDAGAHWTNLSSNLPAIPANAILVDPNDANTVYLATDAGVYITHKVSNCAQASTPCWTLYGSGLPTSPVVALSAYNEGATQTLRAATWGRGIWQVDLATAGITPTAASAEPASLTFASQQQQTTSAAQTVTLTDNGPFNLNITSLAISGDFAETDNCADESLPVQAACQISVTFTPSQSGPETGLLTVYGNFAGGQLTVPLSGTGLAPASVVLTPSSLTFSGTTVGSKSSPKYVTIANTGDIAATLASETVTGDFSITANTCGASLAGNYSCTLGIVFAPTVSGTSAGVLTVMDSVGTQTAPLSGTGQNPATDTLSPASLSFPPQQVGTVSGAHLLTLANAGDQPLTNIAVVSTGDFTFVNNCAQTLAPQSSCTISVSFVPTVAAAESGTVTVTDALRKQTVTLSGSGVAPPGASALPASINFGGLAIGATGGPQTVTVSNSGGYDLTSLAVTITSGFALATNNCSATLTVGSSCQLGLTFTPSSAGAISGTLTISAANLTKPLVISLSGAGEDFLLGVSGPSSAIVNSGQTPTFALQLQGLGGTSGTVALACAGVPQNATCSLNPAVVAISSANTSSVTVSIATGVSTAAALHPNPSASLRNPQSWLPLFSLVLPLGLCSLRRGVALRPPPSVKLLLLAVVLVLTGCGVNSSGGSGNGGGGSGGTGGSGSGTTATPSGTYTLTITGTMANIAHSVQVTLTVQ